MKKHIFTNIILLLLAFLILLPAASDHTDGLEVYSPDVGDGCCTLLVFGDDAMLIDCGSAGSGETVAHYLSSHGIRRLTCCVLAAAEADRSCGLAGALAAVQCEKCFVLYPSHELTDLIDELSSGQTETVNIGVGDAIPLGEAEILVQASESDGSPILQAVFGSTSFLLPLGDETGIADSGNSSENAAVCYVLNKNSHKFHTPGCTGVKDMADKNRIDYEGSRDEVIGMGYVPCKRCNP